MMTSGRKLFYTGQNLPSYDPVFVKPKEGQGCLRRVRTTIKGVRKRGSEAGTAVWPVDYGAETSVGALLQPVLDSVFACGYKEKSALAGS